MQNLGAISNICHWSVEAGSKVEISNQDSSLEMKIVFSNFKYIYLVLPGVEVITLPMYVLLFNNSLFLM